MLSLDIIQGFIQNCCSSLASGLQLLRLAGHYYCCQMHFFVFFVRTVWNNTNQGWKLTPSIQPTVDTILTVASNYVYSIHYLSEWSFQPAGSPVQGALLVRAVLAHSFLLCLVSVYKPTTCIVFLFTTRVLTSPFFQVVQRDAMQDGEDSEVKYLFSFCRAGRPIFCCISWLFLEFAWHLAGHLWDATHPKPSE